MNNTHAYPYPLQKHCDYRAALRSQKLPKNVRFNKSFDVAKVAAEDLSKYTEAFEEILECFKTFSMYIRDGFPINVIKFLRNPAKYEIMEVDKVVSEKNLAQELSTTRLDSTMSVLSSTRLDSTAAGKEVTISLTSTLPGGNQSWAIIVSRVSTRGF